MFIRVDKRYSRESAPKQTDKQTNRQTHGADNIASSVKTWGNNSGQPLKDKPSCLRLCLRFSIFLCNMILIFWDLVQQSIFLGFLSGLKSQAYIPKRRTLIQVLPPLNVYTKSVHAYIHLVKSFCCLLMHICILPENCNYHSIRTCLVYALSV